MNSALPGYQLKQQATYAFITRTRVSHGLN